MDLFVIKEYDLREKYRFLVSGLTLSSLMDLKKGNRTHLLKLLGSETKCHRNKRIITSGRTDGIQLVLNSLPALVIIPADLIKSILNSSLLTATPALIRVFHKFGNIFIIALLCIRCQDLINLRHCKATILLCCCTENDIPHNIKGCIQSLRLVIPDIAHLKTAT